MGQWGTVGQVSLVYFIIDISIVYYIINILEYLNLLYFVW